MPVATAPRAINTTLKPQMNVSECSITVPNMRRLLDCRSSTVAPEIRETYPGTKGSTQGDRNDRIPATNAARGRGRPCIKVYCNNREGLTTGLILTFDLVAQCNLDATRELEVALKWRTNWRPA